jgi:hypothetical protein
MKTTFGILVCVFSFYIAISMPILAESNSIFYKELNLIGGYSDSNEWLSEAMMLKNSIGAEYFRKFSGEQGDYLTLDLQTRLVYDFSKDFKDAWGLEAHNAWLEYKLGLGYKLRVGHFDPYFGLEPNLDTHGTILQSLATKNIVFKSDWGAGFRWFYRYFDYDAALQLGSGMSIKENGNFLLTQRIGKPQENNLSYGLSLLYGKVLSDSMSEMGMSDKPILNNRIGLDAQYLIRSLQFKGEIAYGKNDKRDVLGLFAEADYTLPFLQTLELEAQLQSWQEEMINDNLMDSTLALGLSYKLTSKIALRTAYFHNIDKDKQVFIQFYYFGN